MKRNAYFISYSCRLISPRFADGLSAPRISVTGRNLPLSRVVSRTMHPDEGYHDHAGTVMVIAWGQFMDHDYTLTATPLGTFSFIIFNTFATGSSNSNNISVTVIDFNVLKIIILLLKISLPSRLI